MHQRLHALSVLMSIALARVAGAAVWTENSAGGQARTPTANEPVRVKVQGLPHPTILAENLFDPGNEQIVRPGEWEPDLEPLEVQAFRLGPTEGE